MEMEKYKEGYPLDRFEFEDRYVWKNVHPKSKEISINDLYKQLQLVEVKKLDIRPQKEIVVETYIDLTEKPIQRVISIGKPFFPAGVIPSSPAGFSSKKIQKKVDITPTQTSYPTQEDIDSLLRQRSAKI